MCDSAQKIPRADLVASTQAGCHKHFTVWTALACEPKAECVAQNEAMDYVDLSPLMPPHGHEIVADVPETNGSIYINLCAPMAPIRGLPCPPGTVACVTQPGKAPFSIADWDPTVEWQWPAEGDPSITYSSKNPCTAKDHYRTKVGVN